MPTVIEITVHPTPTDENHRRYQFTPKHHGADPGAACWLLELTFDEEFVVFNNADRLSVCDDDGNYYGVSRSGEGELRCLGTWNQQLAKFPVARDGENWHGYPLLPLGEMGPENRRGEKSRPAKVVFERLRQGGLITQRERKRLMRGHEA